MTLVAAFRSKDAGLLLCADREENTPDYTKRNVDKIYPIHLNPCTIYLAGAGPTIPIIRAQEEIHNRLQQAFMDGKELLRDYKSIIESGLQTVHEQFAKALKGWPMNLLVVIAAKARNSSPLLYWTDESVMIQEHYYAAFGTGKLICDYFSDRLYKYPRLDKPNLLTAAAFIFREAHKSASGVGEDVDMLFVRSTSELGETEGFGPDSVKEIQAGIPPLSESLWADWKSRVKLPEWAAG